VAALLEGKVALVTGGSSGIGRACCLVLAREGAKIVVSARREREGEETVASVEKDGGEAIFIRTDATKAGEVEAMVAKTVEAFGRLDCAVNNAGVAGTTEFKQLHEHDEEEWSFVNGINEKGVWLCMKSELKQMLRQGGGSIVNMSSTAGLRANPMVPLYTASKYGVIGLTRVAARQYAAQGIRVNAICPGWVDTPMTEEILGDPDVAPGLLARIPMERAGQPREIAEAVAWLCSDAASYVTGIAMPVCGGLAI